MECCKKVIPSNAAQSWSSPAQVLAKPDVRAILNFNKHKKILEVGPGCMRNALFLLKNGHEVHTFDLQDASERFPRPYREFTSHGGRVLKRIPSLPTYNLILTTYVIEAICNLHRRRELVKEIAASLKPDGAWILSVRGPRNIVLIKRKSQKCSDGYLTNQRTFVRSYTKTQIKNFLHNFGFRYFKFLHKPGVDEPELLDIIVRKKPNVRTE